MTKEFTSIVTVEFAYNNRVAESKEEYIELLKEQYRDDYNIELSNSEKSFVQLGLRTLQIRLLNACISS